MSEIRPRFYVHKQKASWIIVRMGSDHVVFGSATPSVPVWQKWDEWHDKNVEEGSWVEITYANMRPPAPPSSPRSEPRQSLQQVRLYIPMHDRVGWMMARLGDKFMMLSEWTSEFQLKDWTANEDRQVELGAFREITYPNLRPTRELDDLKAELKEKVRLIEDLRVELDSESLNVQTLEAKLKHSQRDLDEATKTITSLNQGWMDRDNLIDGLRREVDRLTKSNGALVQEMDRVKCDRTYGRGRIKTFREELAHRDDTIVLLTAKLGEKGDLIRSKEQMIVHLNDDLCSSRLELAQARNSLDVMRAMQAGQERGWTYTKVDTSVPPSDIAGNPVVWSTNGPVAQMKTNESLKFTPIPANEVDMVDLRELQRQVTDLIIRFDQFRQYSISRETRLAARVEKLEEKFRDNTLETPYVCKDGKIVRSEDGID